MDYTEFNDEVDGLYRGDYAGLPIVRLCPRGASMPAAGQAAWRISVNVYNAKETFEEHFARFLDTVEVGEVKAIIIGGWARPTRRTPRFPSGCSCVENAARFPALRSALLRRDAVGGVRDLLDPAERRHAAAGGLPLAGAFRGPRRVRAGFARSGTRA